MCKHLLLLGLTSEELSCKSDVVGVYMPLAHQHVNPTYLKDEYFLPAEQTDGYYFGTFLNNLT